MKILIPKGLAFWTVIGAAVLAAGAYANNVESTPGTEITEEESREVADLIQPKDSTQPAPQAAQGKQLQSPLEAPRAKLTPSVKPAVAPVPVVRQTTAQNP